MSNFTCPTCRLTNIDCGKLAIKRFAEFMETTTNLSKDAFSEMCIRLEVFWSEKTSGEFIMPEPPVQYLAMKGFEEL